MRAVTYIRVSTEEEKQLHAFEKQRDEARLAVSQQGWTFVREYADEGKTGTDTKHRDGYRQLFEDLAADTFDVVVIKSQDRLMRNVKDWYLFISRMQDNGKKLYMYMENRFFQSDDSLITGIKAILAEEYSRDLSKKILNSNAHRKATGRSIITNGTVWGYDQRDGELYVNEEEAAIVRRIFSLYVAGNGVRKIKNILDSEGVVSKRGTKIGLTTLKRMIKNPLYIGNVVMNKSHMDFDTKTNKTLPESEWIIHENRVPPIIDKETFELANRIKKANTIETNGLKRGVRKSTYPLSGKIFCGQCGSVYHRVQYIVNGEKVAYWVCARYQEYGRKHPKWKRYADTPERENGCDCKWLSETLLDKILDELLVICQVNFGEALERTIAALRSVLTDNDDAAKIDDLKRKLDKAFLKQNKLLDMLLDGTVTNKVYTQKNAEIIDGIKDLQEKIATLEEAQKDRESVEERIERLRQDALDGEKTICRKYIESHVQKMVVYEDHADVAIDLFSDLYSVPYTDVSPSGLLWTQKICEVKNYSITTTIFQAKKGSTFFVLPFFTSFLVFKNAGFDHRIEKQIQRPVCFFDRKFH